jgi:hypothetical protein
MRLGYKLFSTPGILYYYIENITWQLMQGFLLTEGSWAPVKSYNMVLTSAIVEKKGTSRLLHLYFYLRGFMSLWPEL